MEDIKDFEGYYKISKNGTVYSMINGGKAMTNQMGKVGYWYVKLRRNGKRFHCNIHRALAIAFIPNPKNKPQVNHIDGNRGNNSLENLEWVTASENVKHGFSHNGRKACKTMTGKKGKLHPRTKPIMMFSLLGVYIQTFHGYMEASRETGICMQNIHKACNGKRKTAGGYTWRLATVSDLEDINE